jgi:signal transduction histidine kinase
MSNFRLQPDELNAHLQERVAALELELAALRSQLEQRTPASQSSENSTLETAYALLQTEVLQLRRREASRQEQEQSTQAQLAELLQANQVLQASLHKLVEEPDLEKFLGHLLTLCAQRFAAAEAGLWRYENGIFRLFISYEEGKIKHRSNVSHPGSNLEIARKIRNQDVLSYLRQREIVADYEEDFATRPVYEQFRDYFQQRGIKAALKIPMFLDDDLRGILVLRYRHRHQFQPDEAELAHALANQAVLALELTRLTEEVQQVAIVQQREQAAQDRASELSRANEILSGSLGYLSTNPDFNDVLGHLLAEAVRYSRAATGHLLLYDATQHSFTLTVRCRDGHIFWQPADDEPEFLRLPLPARDVLQQLRHQPKLAIVHRDEFERTLCPPTLNWCAQEHYQTLLRCLLTIGKQPVGLLILAFPHPLTLSPVDHELLLALSYQLALVIQLARAAAEAQQTALLQERNRLAGELHDTLAQAFTGISIQLGVAKRIVQHDPREVSQILDRVMELANSALTQARRSVWALHPTDEDFADLASKLPDSVAQITRGTGIQAQVQIVGTPQPLPPLMGKNLLRIGQEAMTNTLKHADATQLQVTLTYHPQSVELCLEDNGRGFLPSLDTGGFGLISMSDRADRINGQLTIDSELGCGTKISVQVPLE